MESDEKEKLDFDINKNKLDEEWVRQPRLFRQFADKLADAVKEYESAKLAKEVLESEKKEVAAKVALRVRKSPDEFGLTKATEDSIKETVLVSSKYKDAESKVFEKSEEIINLKHKVDVLGKLVESLGYQCKNGLPDLVRLRLADYFAEPRVPKEDYERIKDADRKNAFGPKK